MNRFGQVALRRQQGAGGAARDGDAAALAARKRAYRARLRSVQISRNYAIPTTSFGKFLFCLGRRDNLNHRSV